MNSAITLFQDYPLTLYSTVLNGTGAVLEIPGMADHGYVFLDGIFQVIQERNFKQILKF